MERVLFKKGMQRKFLDLTISNLNCISLRGLLQYGLNVNYNCLKNYYTERRLLPRIFFEDLCYLAKLDAGRLNVKYLGGNWGQVKGGNAKRGSVV
jgi:hypothetical protein